MFSRLVLLILLAAATAVEADVSCGNHQESDCSKCPGLKGRDWCHGDCTWCFQTSKCYRKGIDCPVQAIKETQNRLAQKLEDLTSKVDRLVVEMAKLRKDLAHQIASTKPVSGGWSSWSEYGKCSTTCGDKGTKTRKRSCTNPIPAFGGSPCSGATTQTITCQNAKKCIKMLITSSTAIRKGHLLSTRVTMEKEYAVSFDVFPTSFEYTGNIIHFSAFGENGAQYGDRHPAVWFTGDSPPGRIMIYADTNGDRNYYYFSKPLPKNKWSNVVIKQTKERDGQYWHETVINGKTTNRVVNQVPKRFVNVKVYVSDPWYKPQKGFIRNLTVA